MFALTSMPIGGAERLLENLIFRLDRERFLPEICCLKERGALGNALASAIPMHDGVGGHKYNLLVLPRLRRLLQARRIDAIVTVGAGDKMFWGRIAAKLAGVPIVASALHSTGWPDGIGRLNRLLTPWTDAFIAVAQRHARFLIDEIGLPAERVCVIPNGVDTDRFRRIVDRRGIRAALRIPLAAPAVGIVAALRPEKNHSLFLKMAREVLLQIGDAHFLVVGDGPERTRLEKQSQALGLAERVHFCGMRHDIPAVLSALDLFVLTSHTEANPVSILEAMSVGLPVVATRVGSVEETVADGISGYLVPPGDTIRLAQCVARLLAEPVRAAELGHRGRQVVCADWSLDSMVRGYERLLTGIYHRKVPPSGDVDPSGRRAYASQT
jgi:glycosyltransferase involved in cell wall biosynthesis